MNIGACASDFCFYGQKSTQNGGLVSVCLSKRKSFAQLFTENRFRLDSGRFFAHMFPRGDVLESLIDICLYAQRPSSAETEDGLFDKELLC